jgi:hypothetical protein
MKPARTAAHAVWSFVFAATSHSLAVDPRLAQQLESVAHVPVAAAPSPTGTTTPASNPHWLEHDPVTAVVKQSVRVVSQVMQSDDCVQPPWQVVSIAAHAQ